MDIIRQRQPRKAAGFEPVKPFAHKGKHRRGPSSEQGVKLSGWDIDGTKKVDEARVNWKGILYMQQDCGVYDPRPRLVKG